MHSLSLDDLDTLPRHLLGGVVAMGNFDGVHRGHQAVIATARARASALGAPLLALTFEPHPRSFFNPAAPVFRLTPAGVKAKLLRALGVSEVVALTFDARLASLSADAFVGEVLARGLSARHVVTGADFRFGRQREGTPERLAELAAARAMSAELVPLLTEAGAPISSSAIRAKLGAGEVEAANAALGWAWFVEGEVIHGDKRGRTLGFPTANMALAAETGLAHGVYAARARIDGAWYSAATHFGRRVQFGGGPVLLETHIVSFSGDLYGKTIRVELRAFLRPEMQFDSVAALIERMGHDVDAARARVSAALAGPTTALQAAMEGV